MWEIKQLLLIRFHDDLLYLQNLVSSQTPFCTLEEFWSDSHTMHVLCNAASYLHMHLPITHHLYT